MVNNLKDMNRSLIRLSNTLLFAGLISLVSCKKEYACECVQTVTTPAYTNNGTVHPQEITVNSVTNSFKSTKENADSACKQGESITSYPSPYASIGQGQTLETVSCSLK